MRASLPEMTRASKIESIVTEIVDLPFKRVQTFARHQAKTQSTVLIRIRTNDGVEGIGESVTPCGPWWSGDSVETIKIMIDTYLAPQLYGRDPRNIDAIMHDLDRVARHNMFAKAGLEIALLDLLGKLHDLPVHVLLGGKFRDHVPMAWPIASGVHEADIDEMDYMLGNGLAGAFKVKMGALPIKADLARVGLLSKAAHDRGAKLRVDPNEAWTESDTRMALPLLHEFGVEMIEQPLPRRNIEAMVRLNAISPVPLMLDESVCVPEDLNDIIKQGACSIISLKLMKAGGIMRSRAMADISYAAHYSVYMGTFLETSITTAAALHLAASLKSLPLGGEIIGPLLLAEDIVTQPVVYREKAAWLPEGPGLGIKLDEQKVQAFKRR